MVRLYFLNLNFEAGDCLLNAHSYAPSHSNSTHNSTSNGSRTQLRLHSKPVLLLNTASYYTHLITFVDSAVSNGFIRPDLRKATLLAADEPGQVLDKLREWDGSGIPDILKEKKGVGMEGVEEGGDLSKV